MSGLRPASLAVGIAALVGLGWVGCAPPVPDSSEPTRARSAVDTLSSPRGGSAEALEGFARADGPRTFRFPEDHGPHPDFQTEWWYLTGHLDADDGHAYGFQWTLFRRALAPEAPERASEWATRDVYMGHFALSDLENERHRSFERFSRAAAGLAGARTTPFRVWLEDWALESVGDDYFPLALRARDDGVALELELTAEKPLVLQGDAGFSPKNALPGGASYYYSFTRLAARGTVTVDGETRPVSGSAWLDREWSTSVLSPDQAGWDWFSLQLDSGDDVMVYELRLKDGGIDPYSAGTWVESDGTSSRLTVDDYVLTVLDRWTSPRSGSTYPSAWTLEVPSRELRLEIHPAFHDQELDVSFLYWEGAVSVTGRLADQPVTGQGYVELVGY